MPTRSRLQVEGFFDPATWTVSYIVLDTGTRQCAIVDSVLDYDPKSGRTSQASADKLIARARELGATVQWILETHVHADHLSAAPVIQRELVALVRDRIGPVAAFKDARVVKRLPKTRSGKILRASIRRIADGQPANAPATIDDPAILDEIGAALGKPAA